MITDNYEKLAIALDKLPTGFPRTEKGWEILILKKLFSPQETEVACNMTGKAVTHSNIAEKVNLPANETEKILKTMVSKGIIWQSGRGGEPKYRLAPFMVGFMESQSETMDREFAHLMQHYWNEGGGRGIMQYQPDTHRVVPAHQAMKTEVIAPYDDVKKLIMDGESFEARHCVCRQQTELLGIRKCNFPIQNCMTVIPVEIPAGPNSISKKRALQMLDEAEEVGMVHTVACQQNGLFWVCNCCGDCCGILRGIIELGIDSSSVRANYYGEVDKESCLACGTCADRCHVKAITVNDTAEVDRNKCIGCGICVTGCVNDAMSLLPRPDQELKVPPVDYKAWEQARLQARGLA